MIESTDFKDPVDNGSVGVATTTKILVADDDLTIRHVLTKLLQDEGYTIYQAVDRDSALEIAFKEKPDLILLDLHMPEKEGFEVCRQLKRNFRTADIPVIFLTNDTDKENLITGLNVGAADYLTKNFHRGELLARVRTQLRIQYLVKELAQANTVLREKQAQINEDLAAAACIQRSLLPQNLTPFNNIKIAWKLLPSEMVSGDIFNVIKLDSEHLAMYMVDVCSKGVPASIMTVSISHLLQPSPCGVISERVGNSLKVVPPKNVLHKLDQLYPLERFGQYFTIIYLILNVRTGRITYSQAAHPCPLIVSTDGSMEALYQSGPLIGFGDSMPFSESERTLQDGDKIIFYTDGLIDYQGNNPASYGLNRLSDHAKAAKESSPDELIDTVVSDFRSFGNGAPLQDDATIMVLEFNKL